MQYIEAGDLPYNKPTPAPAPTPGGGTQGQVGTASAPGPAPTPPGSISFGGYTPDYGSLIQNDPAYGAAKAAADLAAANAAAKRKQQLQQQVIQYGGLPAGFTDQYGDLTPDILDQAKNNQFSTLANLAKNYAQTSEQFKRGLAARGALQSGDLNYGEDQLNNAYGQQQYDAANQIGGLANSVYGEYTGVLGQNAQSLASAVGQAEGNVLANPAYTPTPAIQANYDPANSSAYGQPIYVDAQGNQYDSNGNPFRPGGGGGGASASPSAPSPYWGGGYPDNLDWTGTGPVTA